MDAAATRSVALYDVEKFASVWFAMSLLMVGSAAPDPRLVISGIPLNTIMFIIGALFSWSLPFTRKHITPLLLIQLPLLALGLSLMWATDVNTGAYRLLNLILVVNTAGPILMYCVDRYGQAEVARALVLYFGLLLLGAIAYKISSGGPLNRNTPFMFNGPIVFARLMSIALLLSLFSLRSAPRIVASAAFLIAIFWTLSKAPAVAIVITLSMLFLLRLKMSQKVFVALGALAVGAAIFVGIGEDARQFLAQFLGRIDILTLASTTDFSRQGDFTSISSRYWTAVHTIDLIGQNPMGVGLGSWAMTVSNNLGLAYPHNLPLELWSEGGLVLGSIALLSYLSVLFAPTNVWKYIAICLLLNQMFSGSLLDSRYIIVALVLSFYAGTTQSGQATGLLR